MSQTSVPCPECGTEQTSPYGYEPAQTVRCRRCDATFRVPGAKRVTAVTAEEETDDERPRSKWWVVGVLGVLVLAGLGVMGVMRYVERQRERAEEEQLAAELDRDAAERQAVRAMRAEGFGKRGREAPPQNPLFAPSRPPTAEQTKQTVAELSKRLVGVWRSAAPPVEVEYRADGSFRDGPLIGTWKATTARGPKVLVVERSAGRSPVRITFEGDELIHDSEEVGTSVVLRR